MVGFTKLFFAAASLIGLASGAALEVIDPHITSPEAGDVWIVGEYKTVTWDTSLVPPGDTITGEILLGHLTPDGNEHLVVGTYHQPYRPISR